MSLPAAQASMPLTRRPSAGLRQSGCGFWEISWYQGGASGVQGLHSCLSWGFALNHLVHKRLPCPSEFLLFSPVFVPFLRSKVWIVRRDGQVMKGSERMALSSHLRLSWACRTLGDTDLQCGLVAVLVVLPKMYPQSLPLCQWGCYQFCCTLLVRPCRFFFCLRTALELGFLSSMVQSSKQFILCHKEFLSCRSVFIPI